MWPLLEQKVNAVSCDLLFTEDIDRRMRVPNRLTMASSSSPVDEEPTSEETSDADLRLILLDQQRNVPSAEECMSLDFSSQHAALGEVPFLHVAGRSSAQNRRRLNIFQTMYLLGQVLFHRVQNSVRDPVPSSSQEAGVAPEEVIVAEAAAMKKELARISERLCVLEEQYKAWRKEEPLVYSMLLSACLVNTWLWLWR
ncbi:hypothetical protein ASZ78_016874 [Callipepla squamata]|uniref:Mitochondrial fission factor n=1 Tax=Callipepla squamata TaxID=9009 RepID=A0A226MTX0_CALSU|nr:hypothetical protein ASZ78_016874 [Callipepla squamata]